MNTMIDPIVPTIGAAIQGGYFAGVIRLNDAMHGLVIAPKTPGECKPRAWGKGLKRVSAAGSFVDGLANTVAMAEAGSALARWARDLAIGEFTDWYLPARDELELVYRNFKPSVFENWVFRHGDNPSSWPVGYPYTESLPAQTAIEAFRTGGAEALSEDWYWTSTQFAGDEQYAWYQSGDNGGQGGNRKNSELRARAVRRFPI